MSDKKKKSNWIIDFIQTEFEMIIIIPALAFILFQRVQGIAHGFDSNAFFALLIGLAARIVRFKYQSDSHYKQMNNSLKSIEIELEKNREQISNSMSSSLLHQAERCDRPQFYRRMLSALSEAKFTVDLTQFDSHPPKHFATEEMQAYFVAQELKVKNDLNVEFRRIVAIPTLEKLEWVLDFLDNIGECPNFQVSSIDLAVNSDLPPPLSLQIFDKKQICLVDPTRGHMSHNEHNNMLWCNGEAVARVFNIYYSELYSKATILKMGPFIYWEEILTIAERLKKQHTTKEALANSLIARIKKSGGFSAAKRKIKSANTRKSKI